jgi:hypothetical protein
MKLSMKIYNGIREVVERFSKVLHTHTQQATTGRKLAISLVDIVTLGLYKQRQGMVTKKALYEEFNMPCTYKTLVVNLNRFAGIAALILALILKMNRDNQHVVKHVDSTAIPVCLFKNANDHKTMKQFSAFSKNKHGTYFGLKLHLISDYSRKMLRIFFTPANVDDRVPVMDMSTDIDGLLIGDAGYVSKELEREFYQEHKRIFMSKPRKNMKKLASLVQLKLYDTRALIELNFRNLKLFYGLITSLPRSVTGYLANYIYSILAYAIA